MSSSRWFPALAALAALAACRSEKPANWLTPLTRASHAVYYEIERGSHATTDCSGCHGAFDTFARFDCLSCHGAAETDPAHAGLAGYQRASESCYGCHQSGEGIDPQTHARFFPLTHGASHGGFTCASCHVVPGDRKVVDCATCHEHAEATLAPLHAAVDGWAFDGRACLRCHDDGHVNPVAAHAAFPITRGGHAESFCLECHTTPSTAKPWTQDFRRFDCLGCHGAAETDPHHAGVAGYTRASASCYGCHTEGGAIDPAAHAAFFPIAAGTPHAGAACATCHADATSRKVVSCTTCHQHAATSMATAHGMVGGYAATGAKCIACHADAQVDRIAAHLPFVLTAGAHARRSCFECHPAFRADKPWAVSFAGVDCLGCHGRSETDRAHAGRAGYAWTTAACLRCHPDGRD